MLENFHEEEGREQGKEEWERESRFTQKAGSGESRYTERWERTPSPEKRGALPTREFEESLYEPRNPRKSFRPPREGGTVQAADGGTDRKEKTDRQDLGQPAGEGEGRGQGGVLQPRESFRFSNPGLSSLMLES